MLRLSDPAAAADLETYLERALRIEAHGAARILAADGVLAVYVPVLQPTGLLDDAATVLGLRTFAIEETAETIDQVVPMASLRSRAAQAATRIDLGVPAPVYSVSWAGVVPPRGGWRPVAAHPETDRLREVAEDGIAQVANAVPDGTGEAIVRQVRSMIWGQPIDGAPALPAGAAFAAHALGFLPPHGDRESASIYETGPWTRLTLERGHVLVKRRAWSLTG